LHAHTGTGVANARASWPTVGKTAAETQRAWRRHSSSAQRTGGALYRSAARPFRLPLSPARPLRCGAAHARVRARHTPDARAKSAHTHEHTRRLPTLHG
jgi:hypothetical protein